MLTKKARSKLRSPHSVGQLNAEDAASKGFRFARGEVGAPTSGIHLLLTLFVDEEDGVIADAKYKAFAPPLAIAGLEALTGLLVRKNILQARRITAELIDKELRDKKTEPSFPNDAAHILNLLIDLIDTTTESCMDIPVVDAYAESPVHTDGDRTEYPGWESLNDNQKKKVLSQVIEEEVQPYVELDAGGVEILKVEENRVTITYSGNCTTCYSATGSTLDAIGNILRHRVFPDLMVIPDTSVLT